MMLPSFPALRERNLRTLYGNDYKEYIVNGSNGGRSKRGATANTTTLIDKSPKGSVDVRIQPLVNLINCHPDYVTLSSCSGRVALFDPGGYDNIAAGGDDGDVDVTTVVADNDDDHYDNTRGDDISKNNNNKSSDEDDGEAKLINNRDNNIRKSTKKSGKGQGKWIFVTHDILPNLGECIIASLQHTGQERAVALMQQRRQRRRQSGVQHQHKLQLPITFKHEPPLLHIAASNLQSAKHLLQLCKMNCALRESGLVVTESRITVEIRTTSTMLVVPLFIDILVHEEEGDEGVGGVLSSSSHQLCKTTTMSKCDNNDDHDDVDNVEQSSSSLLSTAVIACKNSNIEQQNNDNNNNNNVGYTITLLPSEKYLLMVAELANERMVHNGILIDKLFDIIQSELFISTSIMDNSISSERIESSGMKNVHSNNTHKNKDNNDDDYELDKYKVSIRQTLPPINLWKTAAVALRRCGRRNCHNHHHHQQQQLSSSVDDHNTIDSTNNIINNSKNDCNNDLDVLVFGGQGIGPQFSSCTTNINNNDVVDEDEYRVNSSNSTTYGQSSSSSSSSCCHRWDDVFQLKRRSGVWSEKWATISRITMTMLMPLCDGLLLNGDDYESVISMTTTTVGNLRIRVSDVGMGKREGHTAVVIPPHQQNKHQKRRSSSRSNNMNDKSTEHDPCLSMTVDNAVIIFGGRTTIKSINSDDGGIQRLLLPSNDLFLFVLVPSSSSSSSSSLSMPLHTNSMNDNCKENMNVQQSLFVEKEEEEDNMMGLFGKPLDVRGSPPEARYGHTMTILPNTKQCHGSPFAVVAGGTGLNNCCLASMYTLSCIIPTINNTNINAEDADHTFFQYSHFVWDRIADMPSPRTYHTNFILDENSEQSMKMFVFGGYSVADDPFTSSWVNTPPFGISIADSTQVVDDATPHDNLTITVDKKVQFHMNCIGSAVIALPNLPNVVLVVGGVKAFYDNDDDNDDDNNVVYDNGNVQPLMLLSVQQKQHGPLKLSPKLDVIISSDINNELDFGACVHHCLVSLPSQQDDGDHCNYTDCSDNSEQLIIVGGGVPSLSFGQSYAQ
jgi:tRNA(Phe) wybutosine-synthesizing methylase Tyw3